MAAEAQKVWRVDANVDHTSQISVWGEGVNAMVGTVADFMEDLYDEKYSSIVVTRDVLPESLRSTPA